MSTSQPVPPVQQVHLMQQPVAPPQQHWQHEAPPNTPPDTFQEAQPASGMQDCIVPEDAPGAPPWSASIKAKSAQLKARAAEHWRVLASSLAVMKPSQLPLDLQKMGHVPPGWSGW